MCQRAELLVSDVPVAEGGRRLGVAHSWVMQRGMGSEMLRLSENLENDSLGLFCGKSGCTPTLKSGKIRCPLVWGHEHHLHTLSSLSAFSNGKRKMTKVVLIFILASHGI